MRKLPRSMLMSPGSRPSPGTVPTNSRMPPSTASAIPITTRVRPRSSSGIAAPAGLLDRDTRPAGLHLGGLGYADLEYSIIHARLDVFRFRVESQGHASVEVPETPLHPVALV